MRNYEEIDSIFNTELCGNDQQVECGTEQQVECGTEQQVKCGTVVI